MDQFIHAASGSTADVVRLCGHPYLQWQEQVHTHFTYAELRRLHCRFRHPHVDKLHNLLKWSEILNVNAETRRMLEKIEKSCDPCQSYEQNPLRFKFTLRDDADFNYKVNANNFYIDGAPILHVVDEVTPFQAARFLSKASSESL